MCQLDDLSRSFGKLFLRMHRLLDRRMAQGGASLARTKLLMFVDKEGPARAVDIAEIFGLAPRTVTEALDALERDGFIRRDPDKADRRVKRVSITEEGRRAMTATEPLRLKLTEQIFGVLDEEERASLQRIVDKLSVAVDREEAG
jgi:DNA-binding MarR family transcriptional regulator